MKKKAIRKIEEEFTQVLCDNCCEIIPENNIMTLKITGTGYSTYGGACDSEWEYQLCRHCASTLKSNYDSKI